MEKSILLHCITPEELRQIIKEVIREELLEVRKQLQEKDSEVLMSRQETIDFLKILGAKKLRPLVTEKRLNTLNHFIGIIFLGFGALLLIRGILKMM